jgi:hypothetical protein
MGFRAIVSSILGLGQVIVVCEFGDGLFKVGISAARRKQVPLYHRLWIA